jgi:glycosyltransferase involved in cell wall biosynthesis
MNINPLISVVIPAYNTKDVIERTLKSVEAQTYQNYQMIIIDDGSTDGTSQLLDEYERYNDKCIVHHQTNCGVSVARNKGIECATGEFICFLDSDDTYSPTFFEKMLSRQQQTHANIVYCGFYRVRKNNILKEQFNFNEGNIVKSFLEKCFHISGILFKRSFLIDNNITFDPDLKVCEDIFFTIKAITKSDVFTVKEHLFNYLYRDKSVTNAIEIIDLYLKDINTWSRIQFYLNQNYHCEDKNIIKQLVQTNLIKLKNKLLIEYLKNFNYKQIQNYFNKDLQFSNEIKTFNKQYLSKSEQKKLNIIKSNNFMIWFWGSLYYRYIRRGSKK